MPHTFPPSIEPDALAAHLAQAGTGSTALQLLDVREAYELEAGTIGGAQHIPLGEVEARADELPRDRPVVVYCQHGVRSARAIAALAAQGFTNLTNLSGGYSAWAARDLPPGAL